MDSIVFTSAAILDFLSKIEELKDYDINMSESPDGPIQISIGESTYSIDTANAVDIPVDEEVVDTVEEVADEAYDNLDEDVEVDMYEEGEPIESGVLKELAKSLLLGGMIRLSKKLL